LSLRHNNNIGWLELDDNPAAYLLIVEKVICVEDVIHELLTCGPLFQRASNMLWPFKLSSPNGGWRKKGRHYVDGGDFGNREEKINVLLKKMI